MGLLDGGLQRVALGAFGSLLLDGTMRRQASLERRDDRGRILPALENPAQPCKAFFDRVTDAMRAENYGNRDVRIVCLQLTPAGAQIPEPVEGDEIDLRGSTWRIALPIEQDAAMAAWTFRGTPAANQPAPEPDPAP